MSFINWSLAMLLITNVVSSTLVAAFSFQRVGNSRISGMHRSSVALHATKEHNNEHTRAAFLASACTILSTIALSPSPALAEERSITGCNVGAKNCVSTMNIKQLESYSPPWTFEVSPDEAFARIKGVLTSDDSFRLTEVDDEARYVKANVQRVFPGQDEVEFLVKGDDKVVVFRSSEKEEGSISDFGANRKRIDSIRKRGAVFDLMGGGMTADSYEGGGALSRGNGALGQLKAFYGLQSGQGFETVFEDEE
ncbi:hypothetical protein HJC23_012489 [Cyclotella cryptica]|uniref:Uncharacterized protein n=1 Tax=Cyclotella cryptica TaxID=29204 RepID=A0ABD3PAN6_9STRA|eukprot:CCRYP_016302-RA/>CCRYP_016302-RA protein AED:0.23 eAED:0.23 QI:310/1/1/1/1/1/2/342/251